MARSKSRRSARDRQAGFSLTEVLIAVAIFAAAAAALLPVYSNSLRIAQASEARAVARLHLESLLASLGRAGPIEPGDRAGELDEGFSWRLHVAPGDVTARLGERSVRAYRVTASVIWREGEHERALTLTTLRLGAEEMP